MKNKMALSLEEMIAKLDGATGRLLVASMKDPIIREAMQMITDVSVSLGEVEEITFMDYEPEYREDDEIV